MIQGQRITLRRFAVVVIATILTACASPVIEESNELIETGRWQEGLARLERGMNENPGDPEMRIQYHRRRERTLHRVLDGADSELAGGRPAVAEQIYRDVLAVDATHARALAGLHSIEMASRHEAEVLLVHVMELPHYPTLFEGTALVVPPIDDELRGQLQQQLDAAAEEHFKSRGIAVRTALREGPPTQELLACVTEEQGDLIVIATHGYTGLKHMLLGSTTEQIVRLASCPVLTVRAPAGS